MIFAQNARAKTSIFKKNLYYNMSESFLIDWETRQRICTSCHYKKDFSEFTWDNRRNVPRPICKKCHSAKYYDYKKAREYKKRKDGEKK